MGEASARDLAEAIGKSAETMHYHLKALLAADLIEEAYRRPSIKKPEIVYRAPAVRIHIPASLPKELRGISRKAIVTGVRASIRGFESASLAADETPELRKNIHVIRANMRLKPDDAKRFFELVDEAVQFAKEHESDEGQRLQWSSLVYPLVERQKKE